MGRKRKRQLSSKDVPPASCKRSRVGEPINVQTSHPTLRLYYRQISTLREYLLSQLPKTSKKRRRRIASLGKTSKGASVTDSSQQCGPNLGEEPLTTLLDQTLVCSINEHETDASSFDAKELDAFSTQLNLTAASSYGGRARTQAELVDISIIYLFCRLHRNSQWPPHMLCRGYQRTRGSQQVGGEVCSMAGIPGITSQYPNNNVSILKGALWSDVLDILGKDGEHLMFKMILFCGIFTKIGNGRGNLYQLSGMPVSELKALEPTAGVFHVRQPQMRNDCKKRETTLDVREGPRSPTSICFVRSRMFYARAPLNLKGMVKLGLCQIHALNRFSNPRNEDHTLQLLHYIFPREFGLHNAFTSIVDSKGKPQPFKDYTVRDAEIAGKNHTPPTSRGTGTSSARPRIPKRLRGGAHELVQRLQVSHSRCSYIELLIHYCPTSKSSPSVDNWLRHNKSNDHKTKGTNLPASNLLHLSADTACHTTAANGKQSLTDLATPQASVSAFCRAAISKLVPNDFWGVAESGQENKKTLMHNVDRFIRLRKSDPMSLHEVTQGFKMSAMEWLVPSGHNPQAHLAQSDTRRRKEIFLEVLYYIFDSLLIPLIRSNFYVTESADHQNRLFYFRHDVWRLLTEPAMANIKLKMFREIKTPKAKKLLEARQLGFGQIRLLPKPEGMRTITNLKRGMTRLQNGKIFLQKSVNKVMKPVHEILDFERRRQPSITGSTLFSVDSMYPKLKTFRSTLGTRRNSLYFAKADVKSCFDTIPQNTLMGVIKKLVSDHEYRFAPHHEIKVLSSYSGSETTIFKPSKRFKEIAKASSNLDSLDEVVESSFAFGKRNTIFVDEIVQRTRETKGLMDLLSVHVRQHVVKIGKKFFRQTSGIPQGSVVSSLLCNLFYAQLEAENFSFLKTGESVLMRLVDDFLLITTNQAHAIQFLQIMHDGIEKFGVSINPAKTLANFEAVINGHHVPQQAPGGFFPYCGSLINTTTLEITKDRDRRKGTVLANTLTVDLSKVPGRAFNNKVLSTFKTSVKEMYFDTGFNAPRTALSTIYQNFADTAMKCYCYTKSMRKTQQPSADLLIGTIRDLIDLAFVLVKRSHKIPQGPNDDYNCAIHKYQIRWLAGRAFHHVLGQKQTNFNAVVVWLEAMMAAATEGSLDQSAGLERIAQEGDAVFHGYKY